MMGKVREAVYSTFTSFGLYKDDVSTKHLDIFCGSGSVGLESLSRGAQHCTFIDMAQDCCDCTSRNVKWCQFGDDDDMTRVVRSEAIQALRDPVSVGIPEGFTYNLITLCPPYEEIVYADLLDAVTNSPVITEDTVVLVEYPVELGCLPHVLPREDGGALVGVRNRKYGRTVIAMYVANPTGRLDESSQSRPEEFIDL
jgi:16S rRNA (guanine(966)-N(2))-methyltransferase RsmD